MPFGPEEIQWGLACGIGPDGDWHGWFDVLVHADALRRLGLHPGQPTAEVTAPSPPGWWHAAAERDAHQRLDGPPWAGTLTPCGPPSSAASR